MGRDIVESRKETERQRKIAETIANKPDNYYILTDDAELPAFTDRLRKEILLQREQWAGRFELLGVDSMTAGDFEGTGIDSYIDLSIGFSIWLPLLDEGYYLPYGHVDMRGVEGFEFLADDFAFIEGQPQLTRSKVLAAITPYLAKPNLGKTLHMGSARYDLHVAKNDGYTIRGCVWDTLDAMQTLNEHEQSYGLKPLTDRYKKNMGVEGDVFTFEDLFGNRSPAPFGTLIVGIYAIKDVYFGWRLFEWQFELIKRTDNLMTCYSRVDSKLPETDVFMERCGFLIDLDMAAQLEREYSEELEKARRQVFETYGIDDAFIRKMDRTISVNKIDKWVEAQRMKRATLQKRIEAKTQKITELEAANKTHTKGYEKEVAMLEKYRKELAELPAAKRDNAPQFVDSFELTNGNHIAYLIYDHLEIEDKTKVIDKNKSRSTAVDVMEIYFEDEPTLEPLATVSMYTKLLSTYLRPMLGIGTNSSLEIDGRLHSNFKAGGTSTGRYSSSQYSGRPIDILKEVIA
ncbi:DNA polymerase [Alkalihalobacillus pseudalcaliphilus]|uniref:DNA polymerase n=1 Tax=Alkalihalobacillus pseudalcaliphilus TaxID=79884 RepID=UPI00064E1257|nr:DNA polymerase [Alkalihalobacillus pseudalcaliphilus]KMK76605.1 DNA polymerase I [Alkalihalobacillus pseudalcaliphilus]